MNTPPIPDEVLADHAIDLFLKRYEPLLYAADLGLTPEQVWDQIRYTLQECLDKLSRQGKAGRPQEDNVKPASIAQRERRRQKRSAMERVEIEIFEESDGFVGRLKGDVHSKVFGSGINYSKTAASAAKAAALSHLQLRSEDQVVARKLSNGNYLCGEKGVSRND